MITTGGGGGSHESGGPEDTDIDVAFNLRTPNSGVNILNTIGMKGAVNPIIVGEGLESNPIPRRRNSEINNGKGRWSVYYILEHVTFGGKMRGGGVNCIFISSFTYQS
jgi:hypothetical protein